MKQSDVSTFEFVDGGRVVLDNFRVTLAPNWVLSVFVLFAANVLHFSTGIMSLLTDAKDLWRQSLRTKKPPTHNPIIKSAKHPTKPVTLAVVGCGQRGQVRSVIT
jgi:hypothetical protein